MTLKKSPSESASSINYEPVTRSLSPPPGERERETERENERREQEGRWSEEFCSWCLYGWFVGLVIGCDGFGWGEGAFIPRYSRGLSTAHDADGRLQSSMHYSECNL